jgi:plastocyanin
MFRRYAAIILAIMATPLAVFLVKDVSTLHAVNAASVNHNGAVTLKGRVKVYGPLPHSPRVTMATEPSCMKLHPSGVPAEDVVADPSGGLENVVVYISDAVSNSDPPKDEVVFEQKGCMYHPHVLAMQANQKLKIINDDPTMHNIHPIPQNNREWNKSQPPGMQPMQETFPREEIAIPIRCNVHPWMKGYIAVFKHPYFTVSGKDGNFDIKDLPPGSYTLQAWHEKFGTLTKKITVGPEGAEGLELAFKAH